MNFTALFFWIVTITVITCINGYFFIKALKIKPKSDSYLSNQNK